MKRFIDMIIGLLIILVIMTPFIKIFSKNIDIEKNFLSNINRWDNELKNSDMGDEKFSELQQKQVLGAYKEGIKNEVESLIEEKTEYGVEDINIEIDDEMQNDDYGKLEKISLTVKKKQDEKIKKKHSKNKNVIKVDNVKKVCIKRNKQGAKGNPKFKDSDKIKSIVSKKYGLHKDKIFIYLSTER